MSWVGQQLIAVDCETTGLDPETDRIVTCCVSMSNRVGHWRPVTPTINPGVPIPPEATAVHGITDKHVADYGRSPAEALPPLRADLKRAALMGWPIVGHNLVFDLTTLDREFRRHLGEGLPDGLIVLDTLVLFRRFDFSTGSRSLPQMAARHGIKFPAHDATEDALASLKLLHILAKDNDLLPHVAPETLHRLQAGWYEAQTMAAHYRRLANGQHSETPDTSWPLIPYQDSRPPETFQAAAVEGSLSGQAATTGGGAGVPPVSAPPTRKRTTYREAGISGPVEVGAKP